MRCCVVDLEMLLWFSVRHIARYETSASNLILNRESIVIPENLIFNFIFENETARACMMHKRGVSCYSYRGRNSEQHKFFTELINVIATSLWIVSVLEVETGI
jgi:hypothetical protein